MKTRAIALATALALSPACALAAQAGGSPQSVREPAPIERETRGELVGEPGISPEMLTQGFLAGHPDLRWRREGLNAYANQRYDEAMQHFLRAARYGDKPAQAMIAEMYWDGIGVPQDRALGYVWMDLAAERFYAAFLIKRERYWSQMDEATQAAAIERGQAVLAEYGDDVAKPRMATVLRRHGKVTGSRTGYVGNLEIIPMTGPNAGSGITIRGDEYYAAKYWEPAEYYKWQDEVWEGPASRQGRVDVGDVQTVEDPQEEAP